MKTFTLVLAVMLMGCPTVDVDLTEGPPRLQDAWTRGGIQPQYMLGSAFPMSVRGANEDATYEIQTGDPSVLQLELLESGQLEARALAIGETFVALFEDGVEIDRAPVRVDVPTSVRVSVTRDDTFGVFESDEFPLGSSVTIYAGSAADLHVRYSNSEGRLFGAEVVTSEGDLPNEVAPRSRLSNTIRISATAAGDYEMNFGVGDLRTTLNVHVVDRITSLELLARSQYLLLDEEFATDQLVQSVARDDNGDMIHGNLPLRWTAEIDGSTLELGQGTLLGVATDGSSTLVTATLDGVSATFTADGSAFVLSN